MIFVTQKKSVYVDSVAGSDANDGLTTDTPKATCAAGMAVLASSGRKTIRLKCGSFFREQINLPAGKRLKNYGSGARPILDPRENITGTWTLASGYTVTYQKTVNHSLVSPSTHRVWENGVRLLRVASIALCEATAGTFYASAPSGTTAILYVHASDGGDPNSNGRAYSYSYRMYGVDMADGCVTDGVDTGWNGGNDGSIRALARNCVIRNCNAFDGSKHNLLISEGLCENVNAYDAEWLPGTGSQTAFVAFNAFLTGSLSKVVFRKCTVDYVTFHVNSAVGFYGHGNLPLTSVIFEDCVVKNCALAYGQTYSPTAILSRCVSYGCTIFSKADQTTSWYLYRCRALSSAALSVSLFEATTVQASAYIRHCEVQGYNNQAIAILVVGATCDVRYSQSTPTSDATYGQYFRFSSTGAAQVRNCLIYSVGGGIYSKSDALNFSGNNNIYYAATNPNGTNPGWANGGTTTWTWTQWKTNTGGDSSSSLANPLRTSLATESAFSTFNPSGPVFTSGFPVGVQPTDDAETLALLASVGYTP